MSEFVVNRDMFGEYVQIMTDYSKDMHTYKVVSRFDSNCYCNAPILYNSEPTIHKGGCVPVLNVIHCGIDETKVQRVAMSDCKPLEWGAMYDVRADYSRLTADLAAMQARAEAAERDSVYRKSAALTPIYTAGGHGYEDDDDEDFWCPVCQKHLGTHHGYESKCPRCGQAIDDNCERLHSYRDMLQSEPNWRGPVAEKEGER